MENVIRGFIGVGAISLLAACSGTDGTGGGSALGGAGSGGAAGPGGATDPSGCIGSEAGCNVAGDEGVMLPMVITSAEGSYWQEQQLTEVPASNVDVTVDDSSEAQTWEGFGGGFTELGGVYLSELSQAERDQAMQLLFSSEGAHFAWGRIPIGGNDYVLSHYTLDDTGDDVVPDSTEANRPPADMALSEFSIGRDLEYLIPYIKAAQSVNPELRFWAVPWTPPVWMKTGYTAEDMEGGPAKKPSYYDGGTMKGDDATLSVYAQYFVSYVKAYGEQGIRVEIVAPQNEPNGAYTYPSCTWDKAVYTSFIGQHLGPALRDAGLGTKVMLGGSFDVADDAAIVSEVLADAAAMSYCAVAGVGYSMVTASQVSAITSAGLPVWVSEHKAGNYPWQTETYQDIAPNDLAYAIETWELIHYAITRAGVSAYNAWHMVLDKVGRSIDVSREWAQNALLVADSGKVTPTPVYYVFRHFSRYVAPGAKVVGTSGEGDVVAFKNPDGSLVVVLYNPGAARTMTVAVRGKGLQFSAPGSGFATLVSP